jgi:glycosyltransferase involved in cell wall biosynthesis
MLIVHLTASTFYGGPERQMLGLACALPPDYQSVFISFSEKGKCRPFLDEARRQGFEAFALTRDTPRLIAAIRELEACLRQLGPTILFSHTYKPNILGRIAARRVGIPAVAVSRGWTAESRRVRIYEALDRWNLKRLDHVVCVSHSQAAKVWQAGVAEGKLTVIHNAVEPARFADLDPAARRELESFFPEPRQYIVGAAGRLSPEKGFGTLVDAARDVARSNPSVGFVLFGDGALRDSLRSQIEAAGLGTRFVLPGLRTDIDRFFPHFDLFVVPSYTEGLSNVGLEAAAAGVPILATAVGGNAEIVEEGVNGHLVPAGRPTLLAERILGMVNSTGNLRLMGDLGRERITSGFTFATASAAYQKLICSICGICKPSLRNGTNGTHPAAGQEPRNMETRHHFAHTRQNRLGSS